MNPITRLPHVAPDDGIPSVVVAQRAEISYRMLDHWLRAGYVSCAHNPGGQGYPRIWTRAEAAHVYRMADLIRAGFRVDYAAAYAAELAERDAVRIGHGLIVSEASV